MKFLKTIIFSFVFLLGCFTGVQARILMVSVGINQYPQPGASNLSLAENDARDLANFMASDNTADIRLILGKNATKKTIVDNLKQIAAKAGPDDVLCLFFSGHGLKGGMALRDTYTYETLLTYKEISQIFKSSRARTKLILADTCHSGSMRLGKKSVTKDDLRKLQNQDIILFLSSRDNEKSLEPAYGMKNGVFTGFVLQGLDGRADKNRDQKVTARELFDYVSTNVQRATRKKQHPVMWGKFDANLVLVTYK